MKIAFITSSLGYAGAAKMLCFVAESLMLRGHEIHIINIKTTNDDEVSERSLPESIKIHIAETSGQKGLRRIAQIMAIKGISEEIGAQVLIGFTMYPNLYAYLVGKWIGIPSIMSERGDPNKTFSKSWLSKLLVCIINQCSGGVFQTGGAQMFYGRHLREKGTVIPNPIFINEQIPSVKYSDREKSIVSVGRLENQQKRYDVLLKAFKLFSTRHPEYILKIYGEGSDKEKIISWVKELKIEDKVLFMGLTEHPLLDIVSEGMFVITSDYEGISNALLEAMAVGLPCISTDHTPGGAKLLITDHEDGLLTPVGDAEQIGAAMCEFAENPSLAEKCGKNARKVTQRFAPDVIIDMWEKYIIQIVNSKKARR